MSPEEIEPQPRRDLMLSLMTGLSLAAGEVRQAESYLLELLAWCAFADRQTDVVQ